MYTLKSYGTIKRRLPKGTPTVSCTALKNPHTVPELRKLTGRDRPVQLFLEADPALPGILKLAGRELKKHPTLHFSCLGGRHRSVFVAERAALILRSAGHEVQVEHLELL